FLTISISTDRMGFSPRPNRWNTRGILLAALVLAVSKLMFSLGVFLPSVARNELPWVGRRKPKSETHLRVTHRNVRKARSSGNAKSSSSTTKNPENTKETGRQTNACTHEAGKNQFLRKFPFL
ncbi:MAG: hypothetical protein NTW03_16460, partial [Verrucomicrobia bacterium]|nr:hypothetical protein [Verrucomicrobiota bacterium]